MKYGILEYKNPNITNIGDGMQILSTLNLYRHMGIEQGEILTIDFFDLQTYDGEEVILPISLPFYGYNRNNRITCFSPKIKPIFLSMSLFSMNLEEDEIAYLKQFEPIGCRDEYTAEGLRKKGVLAYLNGCMTLTLDTEKRNTSGGKVYAIDVSQEFMEYIPAELKKKMVLGTSIYKNVSMKTEEYARILLDQYAEQAELVITSRMHAAIPCFATGIPVVFICPEYSFRFTWLEDILHVYVPEEWGQIDWKGGLISTNERALTIRKLMREIACARIEGKDANGKINELHELYEERNKRDYVRGPLDKAIRYLKEHWDKEKTVEYAVWGLNQAAASLIDYITGGYPQAKCVAIIDAVKTEKFKGIIPRRIEEIDIKNLFVFVTAAAVNPYALPYFAKMQKDSSEYFFMYDHIQNSIDEIKEGN